MLGLIKEFGLETHKTYTEGKQVLELGGKRSTYSGTIPKINPWSLIRLELGIRRIEAALKHVPPDAPWDAKKAQLWDAMSAEQWLRKHVGRPDAIALIRSAIRVILGAELGEISLLALLHYCASSGGLMTLIESEGGHQEMRVVGGTQQISERLAEEAGTLILEAPVHHIERRSEGCIVHHERGQVSAPYAILALPLPIADRIRYSPQLPALRDQLTQRVSMGATVKCLVTYERAFWRHKGLSGSAVSTEGPISVVYDNCDEQGRACLLAFVVAGPARAWSAQSEEVRKTRVLRQLESFFGPEAAKATAYVEEDWSRDPFSAGAPVANFPPGTLSQFGPSIREAIGRIHWAGTESARAFTGFMEGAVESGLRAADEILAASP